MNGRCEAGCDTVRAEFWKDHPGGCEEIVRDGWQAGGPDGSKRSSESEWVYVKTGPFQGKTSLGDQRRLILNWDESFRIYSVHQKKC